MPIHTLGCHKRAPIISIIKTFGAPCEATLLHHILYRSSRRLVLHVRLLSFITYYIDHQDVWCSMWGCFPSLHIIMIIKTFGAPCEATLLHHILYWSSRRLVLHVRLLSFITYYIDHQDVWCFMWGYSPSSHIILIINTFGACEAILLHHILYWSSRRLVLRVRLLSFITYYIDHQDVWCFVWGDSPSSHIILIINTFGAPCEATLLHHILYWSSRRLVLHVRLLSFITYYIDHQDVWCFMWGYSPSSYIILIIKTFGASCEITLLHRILYWSSRRLVLHVRLLSIITYYIDHQDVWCSMWGHSPSSHMILIIKTFVAPCEATLLHHILYWSSRRLVLHVRSLSFIAYYIDHQDVWCSMWGYSPSSHIILIINTFGASCEATLLHHILYWSSIRLVLHVRLLSFIAYYIDHQDVWCFMWGYSPSSHIILIIKTFGAPCEATLLHRILYWSSIRLVLHVRLFSFITYYIDHQYVWCSMWGYSPSSHIISIINTFGAPCEATLLHRILYWSSIRLVLHVRLLSFIAYYIDHQYVWCSMWGYSPSSHIILIIKTFGASCEATLLHHILYRSSSRLVLHVRLLSFITYFIDHQYVWCFMRGHSPSSHIMLIIKTFGAPCEATLLHHILYWSSRRLVLHVRLLSFITYYIGHQDVWCSMWGCSPSSHIILIIKTLGAPCEATLLHRILYWSSRRLVLHVRLLSFITYYIDHQDVGASCEATLLHRILYWSSRRLVLHVRLLSFITYYIDHQDIWCFMWGYSPSSHIILTIKTFGAPCEATLLHHILYRSSRRLVLHVRLLSFITYYIDHQDVWCAMWGYSPSSHFILIINTFGAPCEATLLHHILYRSSRSLVLHVRLLSFITYYIDHQDVWCSMWGYSPSSHIISIIKTFGASCEVTLLHHIVYWSSRRLVLHVRLLSFITYYIDHQDVWCSMWGYSPSSHIILIIILIIKTFAASCEVTLLHHILYWSSIRLVLHVSLLSFITYYVDHQDVWCSMRGYSPSSHSISIIKTFGASCEATLLHHILYRSSIRLVLHVRLLSFITYYIDHQYVWCFMWGYSPSSHIILIIKTFGAPREATLLHHIV